MIWWHVHTLYLIVLPEAHVLLASLSAGMSLVWILKEVNSVHLWQLLVTLRESLFRLVRIVSHSLIIVLQMALAEQICKIAPQWVIVHQRDRLNVQLITHAGSLYRTVQDNYHVQRASNSVLEKVPAFHNQSHAELQSLALQNSHSNVRTAHVLHT